jgi:hypothetical protein
MLIVWVVGEVSLPSLPVNVVARPVTFVKSTRERRNRDVRIASPGREAKYLNDYSPVSIRAMQRETSGREVDVAVVQHREAEIVAAAIENAEDLV